MTDTVLIENKTARILGPSYPTNAGGEICKLMPGVNKVPAEIWKKVCKDPLVLHHKEMGVLFELDDVAELGELPVTRAVELVAGTFDKALLRTWRKSDERKPVAEAIDAQLAKLDGSKPDEDRPATAGTSPLGPPAGGVDVTATRGRVVRK